LVTTTSTAPAACAGVVAVIDVALATVTPVAAVPPIVMVAPVAKLAPVIVTAVPPPVLPLVGAIALTVGDAAVGVGVGVGVGAGDGESLPPHPTASVSVNAASDPAMTRTCSNRVQRKADMRSPVSTK
jgi:hypothetical protein